MSEGQLFDLLRHCLEALALVGAPFVVSALVVGLVMSVVQSATQLQEPSLSFVPKVIALGVVLILAGPWALSSLADLTRGSFATATAIGQGRTR